MHLTYVTIPHHGLFNFTSVYRQDQMVLIIFTIKIRLHIHIITEGQIVSAGISISVQ